MNQLLPRRIIPSKAVVNLYYKHIKPRTITNGILPPVLINIHGLFGSSMMFRSLGRRLARESNYEVYNVDLRNHGQSPQVKPFNYMAMKADLIHFIETHIEPEQSIYLLGFSLGGKVGLLTALDGSINVKKCISIDIPPYETPILDRMITENAEMIRKIHYQEVKILRGRHNWGRKVLDMFKALPINNEKTALYFANGFLQHQPNNEVSTTNPYVEFYLPFQEFPTLFDEIKRWPIEESRNKETAVPTLFMKGIFSTFIKTDYSLLKKSFPNSGIQEFATSHNVLVDDPTHSFECIKNFLQDEAINV
ncbi:hypothetical protein NCAS_0A05240 [Naumovozyma castellii]|uniref:AB hydrolase-1 domain-containing protein n=1 Tax=Naumovozyma castellii TaxID=27288 RepID=G0V6I9_NAUCA|nr:hypothetical protein NCAS_0A05240 [Naumovozyma castellii CBS 4309]CCC67082.1 hypothetical protein NCAS_0A05240 [Naumovozyma castellii CBS 4309]